MLPFFMLLNFILKCTFSKSLVKKSVFALVVNIRHFWGCFFVKFGVDVREHLVNKLFIGREGKV